MGKNAEKLPGIELTLEIKNIFIKNRQTLKLSTDKNGVVELGNLEDIESVRVTNIRGNCFTSNQFYLDLQKKDIEYP